VPSLRIDAGTHAGAGQHGAPAGYGCSWTLQVEVPLGWCMHGRQINGAHNAKRPVRLSTGRNSTGRVRITCNRACKTACFRAVTYAVAGGGSGQKPIERLHALANASGPPTTGGVSTEPAQVGKHRRKKSARSNICSGRNSAFMHYVKVPS
jgi:hypothetical protein